ncbi:MAG: hypothetical protein KAT91_00855, partial [Candidatus Aenigmarchaeota archaeon]|nr:hypothetical protein [Candidatus Aenigmarchaeota archaeon]
TTEVLVGIYNTGAEDGTTNVTILGDEHISVIGSAIAEDVFIEANTTEQDATWIPFTIEGTNAGTGIISVTVDGLTKTKEINVRATPIRIDLSVSAIAPTEISLFRSFEVKAIIYNTGNETSSDVDVTISLEEGLNFTDSALRELTENIESIEPTVNGTAPLNLTWYVTGTLPGLHAIDLLVEDNETNSASDTIYVNILDVPETHEPQLTFDVDDITMLLGQTVTNSVTITNTGDLMAENPVVNLTHASGIEVDYDNTPGNFDVNETKTFDWTVTGNTVGNYTVLIHAYDTEGLIIGSSSFNVAVLADTEAPVINSVVLNDTIVTKTQAVHVLVTATDNSGLLIVYADGILLSNMGAGIWEGDIMPNQTLGTHFVTILAQDPSGNTATDMNAEYIVVNDSIAPEPPTGLLAVALDNETIRLNWVLSTSNDIEHYEIYRSVSSGIYDFTAMPLMVTEPEINIANMAGLEENTTYYFVIKAVDYVGNASIASNEADATTLIGNESNDPDGDRLPTDWENYYNQSDNLLDPNNNDTDSDGITDDLEDPDEDGLNNYEEYILGTDPNNPDTDSDGMPDGWEIDNELNPVDPTDAALDNDGDGLTNLYEYLENPYRTDPNNADTDGDGIDDGTEIANGWNPLDPNSPYCTINCGGGGSTTRFTGGGSSITIPVNDTEETGEEPRQLRFASIEMPSFVNAGEPVIVSGCLENAENLTAENNVLLYIDDVLVAEKELDGEYCFSILFAGTLDAGSHKLKIKINNTALVKTRTFTLKAGIDIKEIKTDKLIIANRNTTIGAEIHTDAPGSVDTTLFVNGKLVEKKTTRILNKDTVSFIYAFNKTGENNITIIAALAGSQDELSKKVNVVEGTPTGMLFGILSDPSNWVIVLIILIVAGVYIKREEIRVYTGISGA